MSKPLRTAAGLASLVFLAATVWSVTVTGYFEEARADVPHFEAGAGNTLLLVRAGLAALMTLLWLFASFAVTGRLAKALTVMGGLLAIPLFLWSCLGIERWAPGYSEGGLHRIYAHYDRREPVSEANVASVLGRPLFISSEAPGEVAWHYSYMPSGGFGWHKRYLQFHDGFVSSIVSFNEP